MFGSKVDGNNDKYVQSQENHKTADETLRVKVDESLCRHPEVTLLHVWVHLIFFAYIIRHLIQLPNR